MFLSAVIFLLLKGVKRKLSKLYDLYLDKKLQNNKKLYIFRNGNFYLFLGTDAEIINKELGLKLTNFSNESKKCGFPISEFKKYTKFITLLGYEYEIILNEVDKIIEDIINIDDNNIDGNEAINMIKNFKTILLNK